MFSDESVLYFEPKRNVLVVVLLDSIESLIVSFYNLKKNNYNPDFF